MDNTINYNKDKCLTRRQVLDALLKLTDEQLNEDFVIRTNEVGGEQTDNGGSVIYPESMKEGEVYDSVWVYITDICVDNCTCHKFYGIITC